MGFMLGGAQIETQHSWQCRFESRSTPATLQASAAAEADAACLPRTLLESSSSERARPPLDWEDARSSVPAANGQRPALEWASADSCDSGSSSTTESFCSMDAAVELCRTVASGLKEPRSSQLSTQRESRPFEGLASMTREEPRNGFTYGFVKRS